MGLFTDAFYSCGFTLAFYRDKNVGRVRQISLGNFGNRASIDLLFALGIVVFKKSSFQTQGDLIRRHFAGLNIFGNF